MNIFLTVFVAFNIFLFPIAPNLAYKRSKSPEAYRVIKASVRRDITYTVKDGNSLSDIAKSYYGSPKDWTTIWNDNPSIENPSMISEGQLVVLRAQKPKEPEKLKPELSRRYQVLNYVPDSKIKQNTNVAPDSLSDNQLQFLGNCESGMTTTRNSGNGYYGAFQFSQGTWNKMNTGYSRADLAPLAVQKDAVEKLVSKSSIFNQFPACSRMMREQKII